MSPKNNRRTFLLIVFLMFVLLLQPGDSWRRRRRRRRVKCSPVNCKWKHHCSTTCGSGVKVFVKTVANSCGGKCVVPKPTPCKVKECPPVNCTVGLWGAWGQCSHSCGKIGKKQRERAITTQPMHSGQACPALVETVKCKTAVEKCKYTKGPCSVTCGKGSQTFTLVKQSACLSCKSNYTKTCRPSRCPVHCKVSSWGVWSKCSNTCGLAGIQQRKRRVMTKARHKGDVCPVLKETKVCKTEKEKCHWRLGACSAKCGRGWRVHHLVKKNYCGNCKIPPAKVSCFGRKCKAHCAVSPWSRWSKCVGNVKVRTRKVLKRPKHGGNKCPILKQKMVGCGRKIDCVWKWGACQGSSHYSCIGVQRPVVTRKAKNGGCCRLPKARSCRKRPRYGDHRSIALDKEDDFNEDDIIQLQEILGMDGIV